MRIIFAIISPVYAKSYIVQNTTKYLDIFCLKTTYDNFYAGDVWYIFDRSSNYVCFLLPKKILHREFDV